MRIRRAVDWVEDRQQTGRAVTGHPGFLGEHGQPRPVQHPERRLVGRQVEVVLPRLGPGGSPLLERVERSPDGRRRVVEHLKEANVVHG